MFIGFIVAIILVVFLIWTKSHNKIGSADQPQAEDNKDYSKSYQRRYIFTVNEKNEFRKLAVWAEEHSYYVFPKMRLADIVEPRHHGDNYMSLFGKIRAKHVDFVVCDKECRVKFIIELDDNSHNQQKRKDRDDFVDQACKGAGYTVLHTRAVTDDFLGNLLLESSKEAKEQIDEKVSV